MRSMIILIAGVLLSSTVVHAEEKLATVHGAGSLSCGQYIAASTGSDPGRHQFIERRNGYYRNEIYTFQQWIAGFITALNAANIDDESKQIKVDMAGTDLWMRNWCNRYPTKTIFDAAIAFRYEMRR